MIENAEERALPNLYALRKERLQETRIPRWFKFDKFIKGMMLFYRRVEIGFYEQRRLSLPFIWRRLTQDLAIKYSLREPLRIQVKDTSRHLDTLENRIDFRNYIAYEAISLFISCLDIKNRKIDDLRDFPALFEKILDCLYIFPSSLHRDPLLSFCCFVELNLRSPKPPNSVIDVLKQSCIDCGIEVPDVLECNKQL